MHFQTVRTVSILCSSHVYTSEIQNDVSSQRCVPYDEVSHDASWETHDHAYLSVYGLSTVSANSPVASRPVPSRPVPDASAQSTSVTYFTGVVKSDVVTLIRPVLDTVHYRDTMLYHGWSAVPECQRRNPT